MGEMGVRMAEVWTLTGQLVWFQPAFGVESADNEVIREPAGVGAEAGAHCEAAPVVAVCPPCC